MVLYVPNTVGQRCTRAVVKVSNIMSRASLGEHRNGHIQTIVNWNVEARRQFFVTEQSL